MKCTGWGSVNTVGRVRKFPAVTLTVIELLETQSCDHKMSVNEVLQNFRMERSIFISVECRSVVLI
jgi:hypothetical protein